MAQHRRSPALDKAIPSGHPWGGLPVVGRIGCCPWTVVGQDTIDVETAPTIERS